MYKSMKRRERRKKSAKHNVKSRRKKFGEHAKRTFVVGITNTGKAHKSEI